MTYSNCKTENGKITIYFSEGEFTDDVIKKEFFGCGGVAKIDNLQNKLTAYDDKYGSRHFWCRGYYVDTVGRNKKVIEQYIREQLEEDFSSDQISMKEYVDPFTGAKNK